MSSAPEQAHEQDPQAAYGAGRQSIADIPTTPQPEQQALFTVDTRFAVYMKGEKSDPTYVLQGREALTPVFADLNRYETTTHFNGQSTVVLDGNRGTGESYTIAHHVYSEGGSRKIMIASLRYLDAFTKIDGRWYFAERKLILDWSETRTLT